jgi:hypothetical protein
MPRSACVPACVRDPLNDATMHVHSRHKYTCARRRVAGGGGGGRGGGGRGTAAPSLGSGSGGWHRRHPSVDR